jgi:hypothetical protein
MLLPGYFFAREVGDFSEVSTGGWVVIAAIVLALTALFTLIAVKVQGTSAKDRRKRRSSPDETSVPAE